MVLLSLTQRGRELCQVGSVRNLESFGSSAFGRKFYLLFSGSDFRQVMVPVPAPYPAQFSKKFLEKILPFYIVLFYQEEIDSFIKFIVKCE